MQISKGRVLAEHPFCPKTDEAVRPNQTHHLFRSDSKEKGHAFSKGSQVTAGGFRFSAAPEESLITTSNLHDPDRRTPIPPPRWRFQAPPESYGSVVARSSHGPGRRRGYIALLLLVLRKRSRRRTSCRSLRFGWWPDGLQLTPGRAVPDPVPGRLTPNENRYERESPVLRYERVDWYGVCTRTP